MFLSFKYIFIILKDPYSDSFKTPLCFLNTYSSKLSQLMVIFYFRSRKLFNLFGLYPNFIILIKMGFTSESAVLFVKAENIIFVHKEVFYQSPGYLRYSSMSILSESVGLILSID